jgi:hypothetical protein
MSKWEYPRLNGLENNFSTINTLFTSGYILLAGSVFYRRTRLFVLIRGICAVFFWE